MRTWLENNVDNYACLAWNDEHTSVEINLPIATELFEKGNKSVRRLWLVDGSPQAIDALAFFDAVPNNVFEVLQSGKRDFNFETGEYGATDPLTIVLADPTKRGKLRGAYPRTPVDVDGEIWTPPELGVCNYE